MWLSRWGSLDLASWETFLICFPPVVTRWNGKEGGREDRPWESGLRTENLHLFGQGHPPGPGDQVSQWHLALEPTATDCRLQCCSSEHVTGAEVGGGQRQRS